MLLYPIRSFLPFALVLTLLVCACASSPPVPPSDSPDYEFDVLDEKVALQVERFPKPEMSSVEAAHWLSLIVSSEQRLDAQIRHRSVNENDLFAQKERLNELVRLALSSYRSFPPDLDYDLRRLLNRIDRGIVALREPEYAAVIEVPVDTRLPQERVRPFQFIWPVIHIRVSSPFGPRRDPITGRKGFHDGIDLAGPEGVLVYAAEQGRVLYTGFKGRAGNLVVIVHKNGYKSYYAHLSRILTTEGLLVERGQPIGAMGSTGRSTGSHLHFKIAQGRQALDPADIVGVALEP